LLLLFKILQILFFIKVACVIKERRFNIDSTGC